ncbi:2-phospho-L-lactate transferase [Nocardia sp. BMG111209]|uniref:2-phospho-L-lactate transferase n=1 Tax=Nocardia sp. BMG111209 TaxID=1160137 RepID=UPI0003629BD0|nr:2-phospho-L-lactate transferase [Nocardia sp. BMG111209]
MDVTVLTGGVGGARFLLGVRRLLGANRPEAVAAHHITAVVNVGDDAWMHGLRICPDLDTCMYTLGGGVDKARGWGRSGETWNATAELTAYGRQPDWFGLGDRDLATALIRTRMLRAGHPLSEITETLCGRWQPGVQLVPATDDRSETHVVITDPGDGQRRTIHFQEWWVRYRAQVPTHGFTRVGAERPTPAPGVAEAIEGADVVLLAPSNPVASIGAILAVPGIRAAVRGTTAAVVGISPIIGGKPLRGMADRCLDILGVGTTAEAVGRWYGPGILDGWLVHETDTADIPGVEVRGVPLIMTGPDTTADLVRTAIDLIGAPR